MPTYPAVAVPGQRESVSLDEDDLSDVEDEVFIRDGRNGYKFAEERGVKRPLMAPRRKLGKPDLAARLKPRPSCRVFCIPCCYAFAALTLFLGLIVVVIILVSLFPLPLDKFKFWVISKTGGAKSSMKMLPCTNLKVTDVWTTSLPKFTSESALRSLDVNSDGIEDVVFGFGLGEDVQLPQQWFCPMFLGAQPPCQGGVIALDGLTGQPLWQRWLPHIVYTIFCTADLTDDKTPDCLVSGKGGVLSAINGRDGTIIWDFKNNKTSPVMDVYSGSFIPDQNGDGIVDIIASHTLQTDGNRQGFLLIISGKNGSELVRVSTPNSVETLYAPQLFVRMDGENAILFGTGSEDSPGALYMSHLQDIIMNKMNPIVLYEDAYKGVLLPAVLVDINGDQQEDIVSAMFNSTVVAIDGKTLRQIWNYTVNNSETLSSPTPGFFTSDNVTDFLIKYQTGPGFPIYYYSQTIIIDGRTGKPIYYRPMVDSVGTQMGGLTVSVESYGHDMFIFWMADCKNNEARQDAFSFAQGSDIRQQSRADICKLRFNSTMVAKLYSLNQYNEPPGVLLYTSENRTALEYNGTTTPLEELKSYLKENPDFDMSFRGSNAPGPIDNTNRNQLNNLDYRNLKLNTGESNFRHRDDGQGLLKDFTRGEIRPQATNNNEHAQPDDKYDYDQVDTAWQQSPSEDLLDTSPQFDYSETFSEDGNIVNSNIKQVAHPNIISNSPRGPRSKPQLTNKTSSTAKDDDNHVKRKTKKKNLPSRQSLDPNDYKNVYMARNRLLHDLNDLPNDILRETYLKNRAKQYRNNKFEQRDLRYRENEDDSNLNNTDEKNTNFPESLWDLESEKELEDRENGYWRGKRQANNLPVGIPRITSTGVLLKSLPDAKSDNSIDIVFATYWVRPKTGAQLLLEKDFQCIQQKLLKSSSPTDKYYAWDKIMKEELFTKMCLEERGVSMRPSAYPDFKDNELRLSPYLPQISQLPLGQMTVYRLRLECRCEMLKSGERCSRIRDSGSQSWSSYMGVLGDGLFNSH